MSHDLYASWATSELANRMTLTPTECFLDATSLGQFSMFAGRESGRIWPIPDGRISIDLQSNNRYEVAIEMKRTNEGLHGVLTAIGQSQAYLKKGYSGSAIVIPDDYDTYSSPGTYINDVLNLVNPNLSVGVFSYSPPDSSSSTPFNNKITCHRPIQLDLSNNVQTGNFLNRQNTSTQWAHLREGSSEPDAFFRYLQIAKRFSLEGINEPNITFPQPLIDACNRLDSSKTPFKYLSYSIHDSFHDLVWRNFWFDYVFHEENSILFSKAGSTYRVHDIATKLYKNDESGQFKKYWSVRSDSKKNTLVARLNEGNLTENEAWDEFALNVRNRAHSYREDIDSGLEHLHFIEPDGKPSHLGYTFVDACERNGNSRTGIPKLILGKAILKNGNLAAFLHYIHRLSEERLKTTPFSFTNRSNNSYVFNKNQYLAYLHNLMANNLKVMNTASLRGGTARRPFQAEFAILRKFDFVGKFRVGLGLEINWPLIHEYLDYEI